MTVRIRITNDDEHRSLEHDAVCPENPLAAKLAAAEARVKVLEETVRGVCRAEDENSSGAMVGDLVMLVRKLVHALRKAAPDHGMPDRAVDYLVRHGLQGSPLRGEQPQRAEGQEA